jgi:predicted RND superfamily exporter protein
VFRGIGFGGERIGIAALRHPRSAGLCLAVLLAVIGFSLPRLTFDSDIHRVFLSDSPLSQAQRDYEADQKPPLDTVLVHLTSETPFTAAQMVLLRALSLDLEFIEGVTAVASPFALRWPPAADAPSGAPVFAPQIAPGFADDLAAFADLGTGLPRFVNQTATALLMSVSVDTDRTTIADAATMIAQEVTSALPAGLHAGLTGESLVSAEIVAGLKADLISLNIWGAVVVTLAAALLLRDMRMAVLAVAPALAGAAGVLALGVWLGYPVKVLSNVIPILLLVLGVADEVHLAGSLKESGDLRATLETTGPVCALTALTTAAAFAGIMLTDNAQLFEFSVLGALGTVLSFGIVIVTFALLRRSCP